MKGQELSSKWFFNNRFLNNVPNIFVSQFDFSVYEKWNKFVDIQPRKNQCQQHKLSIEKFRT